MTNLTALLRSATSVAAIVMCGTMAGFFFAFTNPTMMGFANVEPQVYVAAMQEINREVRNVWFGLFFFGALPVLALHVWLSCWRVLPIAAFALYVAAFVVTVSQNVPMNETMDGWTAANMPPDAEIRAFLDRWTWLNTARTLLCLIATAALAAHAHLRNTLRTAT